MMETFGMSALLTIIASVFFIGLSWWALQAFRFDLFVKNPRSGQAKLLQIFLAIFIGHGIADFFIQYLFSSLQLHELFR